MPHYPLELEQEMELPAVEAVLAGTLALMTSYGQALQADLAPESRLAMGAKVARNLGMLADHPQLSDNFRCVLARLGARWQRMTGCTRIAGAECGACAAMEPGEAEFLH